MSETVLNLLGSRIDERPNKVFLYFKDKQITYNELGETVNKLANGLMSLGIKKGDRVSLHLPNCPEYIYSIFAIAKIGAIMVPINPAYKEREIEYVLKHAEVTAAILPQPILESIQKIRAGLPNLKNIVCTSKEQVQGTVSFYNLIEKSSNSLLKTEVNENDTLAIIYTSGTTGLPKGVMIAQRTYVKAGYHTATGMALTSKDRLMTCLPLFHVLSQCVSMMGALAIGGSLILLDAFHPSEWWNQTREYKATAAWMLGAMPMILWNMPVRNDDADNPVRVAVIVPIPSEILEKFERRFDLRVMESYAQTESYPYWLMSPLDMRKRKPGAFHAIQDLTAKIVDEKGEELPKGVIGELILSPAHEMMKGYWKNPEKTAEAIRDGWLYTGDLLYTDGTGNFYFGDRKKDFLRRSGENISSLEVEALLLEHPKIAEVAVIGVPDPIRQQEVKAYIVLKAGETKETAPPEEIIAWCEKRIASFKVPRYIEYKKELPRTPTLRVEKYKLRQEKPDLTEGSYDRVRKSWIPEKQK